MSCHVVLFYVMFAYGIYGMYDLQASAVAGDCGQKHGRPGPALELQGHGGGQPRYHFLQVGTSCKP